LAWCSPTGAGRGSPAVARAPTAPAAETTGSAATSRALFGKASYAGAGISSGAVRLMGVVAASEGRRGHAVLRLDAKRTVAVLQGEEVEPGLRLAEIQVDRVVLERNGARETLVFPEKGK
jgi:general secretion pathway protein C